jgi:spore coat protein E
LSNTDRPVEYRQILTKAVCGKGRKFSQMSHSIQPPDNIDTILGAWVINHNYDCHKVGEAIEVRGSYDINIWYSTKGNTKTDVMQETVYYTEQVPLTFYDRNTREASVSVSAAVTQAPNCIEASIASHKDGVTVRVEKEFLVELTGETKVCVPVFPLEYAEGDEKDVYEGISGDAEDDFHDLDPNLVIDELED